MKNSRSPVDVKVIQSESWASKTPDGQHFNSIALIQVGSDAWLKAWFPGQSTNLIYLSCYTLCWWDLLCWSVDLVAQTPRGYMKRTHKTWNLSPLHTLPLLPPQQGNTGPCPWHKIPVSSDFMYGSGTFPWGRLLALLKSLCVTVGIARSDSMKDPAFILEVLSWMPPPLTIQAQSTACQATVAAAMLLSMSVHVRALLKDSAKAMVQKFSSKQPKLHIFSIPQWLHSYRHCYTAAFQMQNKQRSRLRTEQRTGKRWVQRVQQSTFYSFYFDQLKNLRIMLNGL